MITVAGALHGEPGSGDVQYRGLYYPEGDKITRHMADRLAVEPFYQSDKLAQAIAQARSFRTAVDCGPWVGGWSRELAKWFKRVVAIEANPNNARCVRKNTPANVEVINRAVGERSGAIFIESEGHAVGTTGGTVGSSVPMSRIDDLQIDDVDYLKVHVNGMELLALRGAVMTIRKHRPVLTVVLKPAIEQFGHSADEARAFLAKELNYRPAGGERPYEVWIPA